MSLLTVFENLLTGESTGEFDTLSVRSGGSMQNILALIAAGGGGGVTLASRALQM